MTLVLSLWRGECLTGDSREFGVALAAKMHAAATSMLLQ